jgi:hypothetical protein
MKRAASRWPKQSWRPPARFVITVLDAERLAKGPTFPHRRPPSRTAPQCSTARHYSQVGVRFWECTSGRPILGVSRQRDPAYGSHAVDSQNSKQHRDSPNTERITANCPPAHDHNRHPDQSKHSGDERRSVTATLDDEPSFQPYLETKSRPVRRVWIGQLRTTREQAEAQVARFIASRTKTDFAEMEREARDSPGR